MKKLLLVALLVGFPFAAQAQSAIVRGEVSPGVYENVKTDGAQHLMVTTSPGSVINGSTFALTAPTVTNASAQLLAANTSRKFLSVQNNDAAGIVYINFGAVATTASLKLSPAQTLFFDSAVPLGTITAIGSIASNANVVLIEGQ